MNEDDLIRSCIEGNRSSQRQLYERYSQRMMGVCLRYTGDRETARDLLQDGFIKVFTSLDRYAGTGSFEGWMRAVFVNEALAYLRKRDVLRDAVDVDALPAALHQEDAETPLSRISADELMQQIQALPEGFKAVFNMFAIEGYSHREIAERLHITESTSRSQYARARRWLQERIAEH